MAQGSTLKRPPGRASYLERGRAAFQASRWQDAFDAFREADARGGLAAADLDALGDAAWWLSQLPECISARERAVSSYMAAGNQRQAALVTLRLFYTFSVRGDSPIAGAWLRRAARLLTDEPQSVAHGHLRLAEARMLRARGDADGELACARDAIALGRRFDDADLVALGQYVEGRLLVKLGEVHDGMAILDEAMLSAAQGELDPMATGQVYCNVIAACQELGDLRRAAEWTDALSAWCESQPASVFPGLCRVHRAELMSLRGAWAEAEEEARSAGAYLLEIMPAFAAEAFYEVGEVRRRLGDLAGAEQEYRHASELGYEPQPGLALVRLAQGTPDVAGAAIRRALAAETNRLARVKLLAAAVEILMAGADLEGARAAADELSDIARDYDSVVLQAVTACARGAVALTGGDVEAALRWLHLGWETWQSLDCPFEAARARQLLGIVSRAAGDDDGADLALRGALATFERLGAAREAQRTAALLGTRAEPGGLTARELEVLRLVAAGRTNREIADGLCLSVKTVARHLENIFCKLGVSSRTAAAAFAYSHGLIDEGGR
jgi:ATP/maltotriose-dependent transcriptional regulator MalT